MGIFWKKQLIMTSRGSRKAMMTRNSGNTRSQIRSLTVG